MKSISYAALLIALTNTCAHADTLTEVVVKGRRSERPPTTGESATADQIARTTNAVTPEDALRYLPNVLIRQRHIGDTQSPVTTRTSGVGASARSLIYVDGILITALIGNNNTTASPKWGLVPADAIERVDVLYGPFSAAYPGNSLGSTITVTTRMPAAREASIEAQGASQAFSLYGDKADYGTARVAASYGNRAGRWAFRLGLNHLDTEAEPLAYATAAVPAARNPSGILVTGAVADTNRAGTPVEIFGATGLEHQVQDTLSGRVICDLGTDVTAAYSLGLFRNRDGAGVETHLRDAAGAPVYAGSINIDNRPFTLSPALFANGVYHLGETELAQGLSLVSHRGGGFDFDLAMSGFTYLDSHQRGPAAFGGRGGTDTALNGTGWLTLDAEGIWRQGEQTVSVGAHQDDFRLSSRTFTVADWRAEGGGLLKSANLGRAETQALWVEDAWRWAPGMTATLGLRAERWRTWDAWVLGAAEPRVTASGLSPKAVIAWRPDDWTFKASLAEAYRFPTVSELYQAVNTGPILSVPDPHLSPERAVSAELSAERTWTSGSLRVSAFGESVARALLSQTGVLNGVPASFVQNVDRTRAFGVEVSATRQLGPVGLSAWLTWVDARVVKDVAFAAAVGKRVPQLPRLRGAITAAWSPSPRWDIALDARYNDRAFGTIDNSDRRADTYQGFDAFFVADIHARYRIDRHFSADIGVDNLNDRRYFEFHPFPQRTFIAALKYSL